MGFLVLNLLQGVAKNVDPFFSVYAGESFSSTIHEVRLDKVSLALSIHSKACLKFQYFRGKVPNIFVTIAYSALIIL